MLTVDSVTFRWSPVFVVSCSRVLFILNPSVCVVHVKFTHTHTHARTRMRQTHTHTH